MMVAISIGLPDYLRLKKSASYQVYFPAETGGVGCGTTLRIGFVDFK